MTALSHDHLARNRGQIALRSLGSALIGAIPVPFLDDLAVSTIKRGMLRGLADSRQVDMSEGAVTRVSEGRVTPFTWRSLATSAAFRAARTRFRRAVLVWSLWQRAEAATHSFLVATLFDHYLARHHVGGEIDARRAAAIRDTIDDALEGAGRGWVGRMTQRAFLRAVRAVVAIPGAVKDALTGKTGPAGESQAGAGQAGGAGIATGTGPVDAEDAGGLDTAATRTREAASALGRAVARLDLELRTMGQDWVGRLVNRFDEAWERRQSAGPSPG